MADPEPARVPESTLADFQTVNFLSKALADSGRIVPRIDTEDKRPNIDGHISVLDRGGIALGKLDVQVKKMSDPDPEDPRLHLRNEKFLEYCRRHSPTDPILLIGVDLDQEIAYWKEMSPEFLQGLGEERTIRFDPKQTIGEGEERFLSNWEGILEKYGRFARKGRRIERIYSDLENLEEHTATAIGDEGPEFAAAQKFLDTYNGLLDGDFSHIKPVLYPDVWKLGIALGAYEDTFLSFAIFPVPVGENDALIKKMEQPIATLRDGPAIQASTINFHNPLKESPQSLAVDQVRKDVEGVLENRALPHNDHPALASETLYAWGGDLARYLEIDRDLRQTSDLRSVVDQELGDWVRLAVNELIEADHHQANEPEDLLFEDPYGRYPPHYRPDTLASQLLEPQRQEVGERVDQNDLPEGPPQFRMPIGTHPIGFPEAEEALSTLEAEGIEQVEVPYPDLTRVEQDGIIELRYTPDELYQAIEGFYQTLLPTYRWIRQEFFPELQDSVEFHEIGNCTIVQVGESEGEYAPEHLPATQIYLDSREHAGEIHVEQVSDISAGWHAVSEDETRELGGETCSVVGRGFSSYRSYFHNDRPIVEKIYDRLEERLGPYFDKRIDLPSASELLETAED